MSVPATNALPPAPFRMSTLMAASPSARSHASTSASYMRHVIALRASGRLNVSVASGGSTANRLSVDIGRFFPRSHARGLRILRYDRFVPLTPVFDDRRHRIAVQGKGV